MKKIALTERLVRILEYGEIRSCIDVSWFDFFLQAGIVPVVIPYNYDLDLFFKEIPIDGLFLSGGNDLEQFSEDKELSKKRDTLEKKLIDYSLKNDLPILGTCRGMQLINEFFGGDFKKVSNHVGALHKIIANKHSKYESYLQHDYDVNSFHNFTLDKIGHDFSVSATSADGSIEAIEHNEKKIFGMMWHIEREKTFRKEDLTFVNFFFND